MGGRLIRSLVVDRLMITLLLGLGLVLWIQINHLTIMSVDGALHVPSLNITANTLLIYPGDNTTIVVSSNSTLVSISIINGFYNPYPAGACTRAFNTTICLPMPLEGHATP